MEAMNRRDFLTYATMAAAEADRCFPSEMIALLDRYHGQAHGMFSGDEVRLRRGREG